MDKRKKLIEESKQRCCQLGLGPNKKRITKLLNVSELTNRQKMHHLFINAALPYIIFAAETFKECHSILALIDKEGYVLKLKGPKNVLESRNKLGLIQGVSLREEDAGTTAAAIALKYRIPFYLSGEEYFLKIFQKGSCFAAPIIAENTLLGAIVIVHPQRKGHPHTFTLVQTLAKLIAQEYRTILQGNFIASLCDHLDTGVVITAQDGLIKYANQRAVHILKIKEGKNLLNCFSEALFSAPELINELVYNKINEKSYLVIRKRYNNDFLFLFELLEQELKKEEKIKSVLAPHTFEDIIGLKETKRKAKHYALQNVSILIIGESGTGKELFASSIHNVSPRGSGRFVVVNCAAIPPTLFESELFGYKKGAFTDARFDKLGKIEYANQGTLFLDEIAELPLDVQAKLLRVLEDKKVTPLGTNESKQVDVRFIFATNRDLEQLVKEDKFRKDLYYRLNSPVVKIPPLRERRDEIPELINHILLGLKNKHKRFVGDLTEAAQSQLLAYDYPGNVRELEGILRNAYLSTKKEMIDVGDLGIKALKAIPLEEKVQRFKMKLIYESFLVHNQDIKKTCSALNLSERQIYRYLKKLKEFNWTP